MRSAEKVKVFAEFYGGSDHDYDLEERFSTKISDWIAKQDNIEIVKRKVTANSAAIAVVLFYRTGRTGIE